MGAKRTRFSVPDPGRPLSIVVLTPSDAPPLSSGLLATSVVASRDRRVPDASFACDDECRNVAVVLELNSVSVAIDNDVESRLVKLDP